MIFTEQAAASQTGVWSCSDQLNPSLFCFLLHDCHPPLPLLLALSWIGSKWLRDSERLFDDVTSCYYLAQQLVPMDTRWRLVARPFSVSLYVQPKCSSTSDCRKLHGHFNTVFFSSFFCSFREQKEKCIIIWKTLNLYAGEKIFTI